MESADSPASAPNARAGFALIVLSHFLCALGFSVFSLFPKYLMVERGMSQAEAGTVTMGLPLGALLFSPLAVHAMRRFPKSTIVRVCALAFAVLSVVLACAPDVRTLPLLATLVGGACMGVFNGGAGLTAEVASEHAMARALGLHGAAGMLSHALGPVLLEPLASRAGFATAFLVAAAAPLLAASLPLATVRPRSTTTMPAASLVRPLAALMVVSTLVGIMHNALWTQHQPLVLARGGQAMRGYFVGMSFGALIMRVAFGGLPDRVGHLKAARYAALVYVVAAFGMTFLTPETLPVFGLLHGVAHGVFYPAMAALATARVSAQARGEALTAIYAAFNVGASLASFGLSRFGEAEGPAAVFPLAAAFGACGLALLCVRTQPGAASMPVPARVRSG